ncbi:MAG: universal stress protein [Bacteroidota bacterium]
MKNILVATDLEPKTQELIDFAITLAEKFGSKIWVVHIAEPEPDFVGYEVGPQYIRDAVAKDLRTEHKMVQNYTRLIEEKDIEAEGLMIQGPTIEMLLEEIKKLHADLIIIGSHKHSFLYKAFNDDISAELLKKSKIPLLVLEFPQN